MRQPRLDWEKRALLLLMLFGALALCVFGLFGCNYVHLKAAEPPPPTDKVTFDYLREHVFLPRCVGCHNNPTLGDFAAYDGVMKYVVEGKPDESRLCLAVRAGRMPPGSPLPSEIGEMICEWIRDGASEPPPIRNWRDDL